MCSFVSSGRKFKYKILIDVDLNLVCLLEMERNQLNYIFEYLIPQMVFRTDVATKKAPTVNINA